MILRALPMRSGGSLAHSVLAHEQIVDMVRKDEIRPRMLTRFLTLTGEVPLLREIRHEKSPTRRQSWRLAGFRGGWAFIVPNPTKYPFSG